MNVDALFEPLDQMHKDVDSSLSTSWKQAVERYNAKPHVILYKPTVGGGGTLFWRARRDPC